jgi:uncharacterized protein
MVADIYSRLNRTVLVTAVVLVSANASAASGQSFDCAKATSAVEKMICSDTELKALDTRMAQLYAQALKVVPAAEEPGLRSEQRDWITTRDACATASEPRRNCVSYAYTQRNSRLDGLRTSTAAAASEGPLTLTPGQAPATYKGTVVGRGDVTYTVPGRKGQTLGVDLQTTSTSLYFNVLPAGSEEAVYASDRGETGNKAAIVLPADGDYRVMVYLFRNEARRGTKAAFTISLSLK